MAGEAPLATAVELAGGLEAEDAADRQQLELLGEALPLARRPGRPAGSRNRATEFWRNWILSRYPSPLEALARIYSRPLEELRAELRCSRLEAMNLQRQAAEALAPYLHGKMPVQVDLNGKGLVPLIIVDQAPETLIEGTFEAVAGPGVVNAEKSEG